jgi:hypothetical protein
MMTEMNKGIRCGNHGTMKFYHASVQDVRECYEWSSAQELPAWMIGEDPDYVRPTSSGEKIRGWYDLPIAASMWASDARSIER